MHCLEPELSLDEDKRDQHCSCPRVQQTFTKASHCWLSVLLVFKKISGCSPTKKKITKTSKCPWQEWTLKSKLILSPNEDSLLIGILLLLLLENAPELQSSPKGFFFFFPSFLLHSFLVKVPISHSPAISAQEESIHASSENEHPFPNDLPSTCSLTAFLI